MIHLDHNHHPSPLSPHQKNLILPPDHKILAWSDDHPAIHDFIPDGTTLDQQPPPPPPPPAPSTDPNPVPDKSSSLSPVSPEPKKPASPSPDETKTAVEDKTSRQSTPLSELSPPPDDFDASDGPAPGVKEEGDGAESSSAANQNDLTEPQVSDAASQLNGLASSPTSRSTPSFESIPTPSGSATSHSGDAKVVSILELNTELLKVCMEFQGRGVTTNDPRYNQYSSRLQSNLAWLAAAADQSRQGNQNSMQLPAMDPPSANDLVPITRIQQIYAELPTLFSKDIERRQQMLAQQQNAGSAPNNLKRDRPEDSLGDMMNKRRDTGESKGMMRPPSGPPSANQNPFPMTNGAQLQPTPSLPISDPSLASAPGLANINAAETAAANRERVRQAQIRAAQLQQQQQQQQQAVRQMSPPSSTPVPPNPMQQPQQMMQNAVPGPSNLSANGNNPLASMPPQYQQAYNILQNPQHPFMQYMIRNVPNFMQMPMQQQMQRMIITQNAMQAKQQEQQNQQRNGGQMQQQQMPGMSNQMQANGPMPGGPFPGQTSPVSPQAQPSQMVNPMAMGPGAMNSPQIPGGGMNMNNMSLNQRQFMLMQQQQQQQQQQQRVNMHQQQQQQQQQAMLQERFRMEQERMNQQRLQAQQQQQQINNSPHVGSPMALPGGGNDNFPVLRSNSTIPGIARSTRSPSDGAPSPMTPRIPQRGVSVGQEDFQRMMMQQQQNQQNQQRGMPQGFNPQQMQQQQQQQTHWQQQMAGHNQGFGMSRPPSAGFGVPSPPGGGGNWQQAGGGGSYPFAPSPGSHSDLAHTPRHMSATPVPQQMHSQNNTPTVDPTLPPDLDLFNWAQ